MAANFYTLQTTDGPRRMRRAARQGRKPMGLQRWTGRLFGDDLEAIRLYCQQNGQQENDVIRCAVNYWRNFVLTELLKP